MFAYKPNFIPQSIVLIGAGGTGSRLMPMLAQLVRSSLRKFNPSGWIENINIVVVDGDVVEEKNLLRQNFIQKDVGNKKASVLANRYSNAFGINISAYPEFIRNGQAGFRTIGDNVVVKYEKSIVILAVDSADARRTILNHLQECLANESPNQAPSCFIIDAGNEDSFGQIKFFTMSPMYYRDIHVKDMDVLKATFPKNSPVEFESTFIPFDPKYYSELGGSAAELSCAELPQTLAINAMMATMICCITQNFLQFRPMTYDGLRFSMNGAVSTDFNTAKRWLDRAVQIDTQKGAIKDLRNQYTNYRSKLPLMNVITSSGLYNSIFVHGGMEVPSVAFFSTCAAKTTLALKKMGMKVDENRDIVPITPIVPISNVSEIPKVIPPLEAAPKRKPRSKVVSEVETISTDEAVVNVRVEGVPPLPQATPVRMEEVRIEVGALTLENGANVTIRTGTRPVAPTYNHPDASVPYRAG